MFENFQDRTVKLKLSHISHLVLMKFSNYYSLYFNNDLYYNHFYDNGDVILKKCLQ